MHCCVVGMQKLVGTNVIYRMVTRWGSQVLTVVSVSGVHPQELLFHPLGVVSTLLHL